MDQAPLSSHKKRIARHFSVEDKERILNIFKACDRENPERPKTENVEVTAKAAGVSVTSVFKILREYKKTQGLHPPKVYRRQRAILDNINDGTKSALRRLIHSFFERNEPPTLDKVLAAVREDERLPQFKRTTLWTLIKEVGFRLQPSQSTSASTANPFVELEESPYSPQQSTCTNASSTAYPFKSKEPSCRCCTWLKACGREDLLTRDTPFNSAEFYRKYRICSVHFEDHMYNNPFEKSRLLPTAEPTQFIQPTLELPLDTEPQPTTSIKQPHEDTTSYIPVQNQRILENLVICPSTVEETPSSLSAISPGLLSPIVKAQVQLLNRSEHGRRKDLSKLEDISKTQLTCAWSNKKGSVREKYKAVSIKDMPCIQAKANVGSELSDDVRDSMLLYFIENLPNSTIAKHRLQPSTSTTSSPTTDPLIMLEEVSCSQMQEPGIDTTLEFLLEPSEQPVVNVATKLKSTSKRHKDKIYCRLCLKTSNKNSLTPLSVVDFNYPGKSDAFKKKKAEKVEEIHKMIKFCLPFFDSLTFNPIICSICLSRLKSSYDFANECLKNQRLIKKYADIYGTTERVININEMIESKFSLAGNKSDSDTDTTLSIPKVTRSSTRVPQQTRGEEHLEHLHEDGPATKKQKIYIESREENSMTSSNEDTLNIKTEPYEDDGSASKEFLTQDIPIRDIDQDNMDNITDESMIKVEPDCIDIIDSTDFIKTEPVDDLHIENEEFNKRTGIGTDIQEQHFYFRKTKNVASDAETNIPSFTSEPVFLNVDSRLEATTSDVNYVVFKMTDK